MTIAPPAAALISEPVFQTREKLLGFALGMAIILAAGTVTLHSFQLSLQKQLDSHAQKIQLSLASQLKNMDAILTTLTGVAQASAGMNETELTAAAQHVLQAYPTISMIARSKYVNLNGRRAFEAMMQQNGFIQFSIKALRVSDSRASPMKEQEQFLPIDFLEPLTPRTARLMGSDLFSNQQLKTAIKSSIELGGIVSIPATSFSPTKISYLTLQATYRGYFAPETPAARIRQFHGVYFLIVEFDKLLIDIRKRHPNMGVEIFDPGKVPNSFAKDAPGLLRFFSSLAFDSFSQPLKLNSTRQIELGGTLLLLHVSNTRPQSRSDALWSAAFSILIATLLLSSIVIAIRNRRLIKMEKTLSEASILVHENRFKDFAETASDWFWEMDGQLRFCYFSDRFVEISGVQKEDLLGKTRQASGLQQDHNTQTNINTLQAHRAFKNFEHSRVKPNGETVYMSTNGNPVFNQDNVFIGYRGTGTDITKQTLAKQALEKQQHELDRQKVLFEGVFNDIPDAMILTNIEREIFLCNPAFTRIFGYDLKDIKGKKTSLIYESREEYEHQGRIRFNIRAEQQLEPYEVQYKRKNGEIFTGEAVGGLIKDRDGNTTCMIGVFRDISRRKSTESELVQLKKMESLGSLTAGIAHNLNNFLQPIALYSALLLENYTDESETRQAIENILRSSNRAGDLVKQLMLYSRQERGKMTVQSISSVMNETLSLLLPAVPATVKVHRNIDENTGAVFMNKGQIQSAVMNLFSNAIDSLQENIGEITITLSQSGGNACITIVDTGKGMDAETQERMFDPFYSTKDIGKGTGLGLSTVRGVIEDHGGVIHYTSSLGKGTTFQIILPLFVEEHILELQCRGTNNG